ncbi:hypothetical protein BDZ90DRAFT_231154 [Jaminaea rosea]|uniref:BZIP domain-containing protein n=1 Tax=Jaminaea rosea TaxID=1569628 RepID=A0A316V168_9BASI|nr:hypothetical protein BDZ90DRAFT_231154 [Jaminaea rosea]PWN29155.1 hypothetical protein BDZ90DRAFT_231154 [Jaminaea rosea]
MASEVKAKQPARPPARPQPQAHSSRHALEPNPFEQSFSSKPGDGSSASPETDGASEASKGKKSVKADSSKASKDAAGSKTSAGNKDSQADPSSSSKSATTPGGASTDAKDAGAATPRKGLLPPVASLASPSVEGGSHYPWSGGGIGSLRSGPLSPAMLTGPQSFDPASFRTGFTPDLSNFKTGLTPLGSANGYPLPSPGTSAFLAMVNQGGSTITPNTFNAITNSFGGAGASGGDSKHTRDGSGPSSDGDFDLAFGKNLANRHAPQSGIRSSAADDAGVKDGNEDNHVSPSMIHQQQQQQPPQAPPQGAQGGKQPNGQPTSTQAASGLFLLSQAHQELSKRDEAAASHGHPVGPGTVPPGMMAHPNGMPMHAPNPNAHYNTNASNMHNGPTPPQQQQPAGKSAPKRKKSLGGQSENVDGNGGGTSTGKKGGVKKAKALKKESSAAPSASVDEDQDELSGSENGGPNGGADGSGAGGSGGDDDEEKRKNFLERNRQAALKCRQRKKAWLQDLQAKVAFFESENGNLQGTIGALRNEVMFLKQQLMHTQQHMQAKGIQMPGPMPPPAGQQGPHDGPGGPQAGGGMMPPNFVPPGMHPGQQHPHHHHHQQQQQQQQQQQGPPPGQGYGVPMPGAQDVAPNERAFSPAAGPKAQAA